MTLREADSLVYPRDVPAPEGFPEGWKTVQHVYGPSAKSAGQIYTRYYSRDGRHKCVTSAKQAFELHCRDHPSVKPEELMETYLRAQAERKARLGSKARDKGPKRDAAIELFRERCGSLNGPTIWAFPGWHVRWDYLPNCSQVQTTYIDDAGRPYKLLKDIECMLGLKFAQGEEEEERIAQMVKAASERADSARYALGPKTSRAREGTFAASMDEGEKVVLAPELRQLKRVRQPVRPPGQPAPQKRQLKRLRRHHAGASSAERPRRLPRDDHRQPWVSLDPVGLRQEGWAALVETEWGARRALAEFHQLLVKIWSPASIPDLAVPVPVPELLAVYGAARSRRFHQRIHGVYRSLPDPIRGKPAYQRLLHAPSQSCVVGVDRIYLVWSRMEAQWQFTSRLTDDVSCLAFSDDDVDSPLEVDTWQMRDDPDNFSHEAGLALLGEGQ